MHTNNRPIPPPGPVSRFGRGVVFTLTLLSAACSDATAPVDSPSFLAPAFSVQSSQTSFAVLANAAVTCTDGKITGDVGTYLADPTGSVTRTRCPITGTIHVGDASAVAAYEAFVDTYEALTPELGECTVANTLTGTLANETLAAGTYCISAEAKTGVLTLTGGGSWTFKVLGALTGTNFSVVMADEGEACDVTWWVAAAVEMTDSNFLGNILAGAAITLTRGTFGGNAWSQADVTITGTATSGCEGSTSPGNDNGKCNQGVGNLDEGCDPGNSNNKQRPSNDEDGGTPGNPGRKGGP